MEGMTRKKLFIHLHHISSHFTNGLFPMAAVMITLHLLTGNAFFETTAFHCIVVGLLGVPLAYGSGVMDWKKRFEGRRTRIFDHKIAFGLLFLFLGAAAVFLRFTFEESIHAGENVKWVYVALIYLSTAVAAYLGHLGSKFI